MRTIKAKLEVVPKPTPGDGGDDYVVDFYAASAEADGRKFRAFDTNERIALATLVGAIQHELDLAEFRIDLEQIWHVTPETFTGGPDA